jgi:hypothetical protein
MDDADRRYICQMCCNARQSRKRVGLLRESKCRMRPTRSGTLPNGIDRNQSVRTSRLCADYFTSIKMTSSKGLMADSSFIDKLS